MMGRLATAVSLASLPLCVVIAAPTALCAGGSLSFDSKRVLDLSGALRESARGKLATRPVDIDTASKQTGSVAVVLERPEVRRGDAELMAVVAQRQGEARRIAARRGTVSRKGALLTINSRSGDAFRFQDWAKPATQEGEGDEESFVYAGVLKGTGYHKVDIHFGHDSPGSFLVHPRSGKLLFVHTEDDLASLSQDRSRLLVMNSGLNPPFGLLLAGLRKDGPAVRLHCLSEGDRRIIPSFRGWHAGPALGFDVVLVVRQEGEAEAYEALPLRFLYLNNEWRALAPDADRLSAATGLTCWQ
jgi:hypothetical protein